MQNNKMPVSTLLRSQRSHVLFTLSRARDGRELDFRQWYRGPYSQALAALAQDGTLLSARHYEQHEIDFLKGEWPRLPYRYLGLYELSLDGAEQAEALIERIALLHERQATADTPATWLYYPSCEKVGRPPAAMPSLLMVAFTNGLPGQEAQFREWYATRHIRHALSVPPLVSGQCFERTQFQRPGALAAGFSTITVYEQEGTAEELMETLGSLSEEGLRMLRFPTLDTDPARFTESVYRPL